MRLQYLPVIPNLATATDETLIHQVAYPWCDEVATAAAILLARRLENVPASDTDYLAEWSSCLPET